MKFFKVKAILLASLFLIFTGCTGLVSQQDKSNPQNSENAEGGITSGGGGVVAAEAITQDEFYHILSGTKLNLRYYFNFRNAEYYINLKMNYDTRDTDSFYIGVNSLSSALERIELETQDEKPCYDEFGNEVDASYVKSKPNLICLSVFRLKSKLDKNNVYSAIYPLIVHELSHAVGATEEQALALQKEAITDFELAPTSIVDNLGLIALVNVQNKIKKVLSNFDESDLLKIKKDLNQALAYHAQSEEANYSRFKRRSLFDYKTRELNKDVGYLLDAIGAYLNPDDIDKYNELFKDLSKIYTTPSGRKIKKIESIQELKLSLKLLLNYFNEISLYAAALELNNPIPQFLSLSETLPVNPWAQFAGKYSVSEPTDDCKNIIGGMGKHTTMEITVDPNNPYEVFVTRNGNVSTVKEPYFTNGNAGYALHFTDLRPVITVYAENNSAVRTLEIGNKWPQPFYIKDKVYSKITETMTLKDLEKPNRFEFKIVQETYKFKPNGLSESNTQECVMTL